MKKRSSTAVKTLLGVNAKKLPHSLSELSRFTYDDMRSRGVPDRDCHKIMAALQLAKEIAEPGQDYNPRITNPESAIRFCRAEFVALMNHGTQEEFWCVTLNTKNEKINSHMVTRGTLRNSLVHPREVFRPAIADAANCILVVHNHPSGDPTPSDQDISVTERLEAAAEIIRIPVIDHIVVAQDRDA